MLRRGVVGSGAVRYLGRARRRLLNGRVRAPLQSAYLYAPNSRLHTSDSGGSSQRTAIPTDDRLEFRKIATPFSTISSLFPHRPQPLSRVLAPLGLLVDDGRRASSRAEVFLPKQRARRWSRLVPRWLCDPRRLRP